MNDALAKTFDLLYGRPWSDKEYIIVLAAYAKAKGRVPSPEAAEVEEISVLLGRTPGSIVMRMENFASLDSKVQRVGLRNVSPACRRIFATWSGKPDELRAVADYIKGVMREPQQPFLFDTGGVIRIPWAFKQYELFDRIADGYFGEVYSCINVETGHGFAVKILKVGMSNDREAVGRFMREIRALKAVQHPNVIRLFDDNLDLAYDCPAYVMELGRTNLADYILDLGLKQPSGKVLLAFNEAATIMRSVIAAVSALHNGNPQIIHRDINFNNILLMPDGRWVLADFGFAKFVGQSLISSGLATSTQRGWGTGYFTAPEQYVDFKRVDKRTDIYSLGVLLWELFSSDTPPPRPEVSCLPLPLHYVFLRAISRNPDERHASVEEFSVEFEEAVQQSRKMLGYSEG